MTYYCILYIKLDGMLAVCKLQTKRKVKRVSAQRNLISKGLPYLFHVKLIWRNAAISD